MAAKPKSQAKPILVSLSKIASITSRVTPLGFAITITGRNSENDAGAVVDVTFDWSWMVTLADRLRGVLEQRAEQTQSMLDKLAGK